MSTAAQKSADLPTAEMVAAYDENPANYLCVTEVEDDVVHKCGIVKPGPEGPDGRVTQDGSLKKRRHSRI